MGFWRIMGLGGLLTFLGAVCAGVLALVVDELAKAIRRLRK
jgi:hypothetical protein